MLPKLSLFLSEKSYQNVNIFCFFYFYFYIWRWRMSKGKLWQHFLSFPMEEGENGRHRNDTRTRNRSWAYPDANRFFRFCSAHPAWPRHPRYCQATASSLLLCLAEEIRSGRRGSLWRAGKQEKAVQIFESMGGRGSRAQGIIIVACASARPLQSKTEKRHCRLHERTRRRRVRFAPLHEIRRNPPSFLLNEKRVKN